MSINLLPWRKKKNRKKRLHLFGLSLTALFMTLPITLHFYSKDQALQKSEAVRLNKLLSKIQGASINSSQNPAQRYQDIKSKIHEILAYRKSNIMLSDKLFDLIEGTPLGISLTRLSFSEKHIVVEGISTRKEPIEIWTKNLAQLFRKWNFSIKIDDVSEKIPFKITLSSRKKNESLT